MAILLLHQFEEYSYPGNFKDFFNANIWNKNPITRFQLTDKGIIVVNVILAWTAYLIAAIYGEKLISLTIGLIGISLLNGILHTLMYFTLKRYNPGLMTGLLLFIPFGIFFLIRLQENITPKNLILGIIVFIAGTFLVPLSIKLANKPTVPNNAENLT